MPEISILTWNIALGGISSSAPANWDRSKNIDFILDEIEQYKADIICLQEIPNHQFSDFFSNDYLPGDLVKTHSGYTGIFLRKGKIDGKLVEPKSKLTFGPATGLSLNIGSDQFVVFSVHLPSTADRKQKRQRIMEQLLDQLDLNQPLILAGDTNLRNEEAKPILDRGLDDAYSVLKDIHDIPVFTFHTGKNRYHQEIPVITARFDRIYYRNLKILKYQLVGTTSQSSATHYLSDHFGIFSIFEL